MTISPTAQSAPHFLFDLDGTVLDTELLPLIGRELGLEAELATLTRLTMTGRIPFEESFRQRVEMLRVVPPGRVRDIIKEAPINPHIAAFIGACPDRCTIVTGNCDIWVRDIVAALGCELVCSLTRQGADGLPDISSIVDKGAIGHRFDGNAVAIGDGHNDLPMFQACRYSVAYGGVHSPAPALLEVATHAAYDANTLCRLLSQFH